MSDEKQPETVPTHVNLPEIPPTQEELKRRLLQSDFALGQQRHLHVPTLEKERK